MSFSGDYEKKKKNAQRKTATTVFGVSAQTPFRQTQQTAASQTTAQQRGAAIAQQRDNQRRTADAARKQSAAVAKAPAQTSAQQRGAAIAQQRDNRRRAADTDRTNLQLNQIKWHQTSNPAQKASLHQQNNEIRNRLGLNYSNGVTFDNKGRNYSLGTQMLFNKKAPFTQMQRQSRFMETKEVAGKFDKVNTYPTMSQLMQGVTKESLAGQTGENAHRVMRDLYNRSGETWSAADRKTRDTARQALTDEMSRIYQRYGLQYIPRDNVDSTDVMRRLRAAGADNQTLAYVQENIDLRNASDRLGQGMTAVGNRLKASILSLLDTAGQEKENRSKDYQNEQYRALYEREQQLETQLQNMVSQNADGSVPAEYQAVYDELQRVRNERNSIAVQKGVDPNKWSQRMLREANEAQANAEAGLAAAPRWLTEQAISLAGNAPTMAASAIPVIGPALGTAVIGAQAAGQRAFELNEAGKSAGEALGRGLVSGMIEAATEKLPLEQMADILHSGGTGAVQSILKQMGTEATEEGVSYFLNYVSDLAAADPDAKFSLSELVQSAAGGAFGGLVFGTAGNIGAKLASNTAPQSAAFDSTAYDSDFAAKVQQYDTELRQAQSLPEGTIKDNAVQSAAGGAFGGLVFGTAGNIGAKLASNTAPQSAAFDSTAYDNDFAAKVQQYDTELRQAQSLPEGTIKDNAVQTARNKLAQTIEDYVTRNIAAKAETAARNGAFEGEMPSTATSFEEQRTAPKPMDTAAQQAVERNRTEFAQAQAIAERLGARFAIEDIGTAGGKYENGTIMINPYTENPVQQVLVHELTHHLESSGNYQKLQDAALRAFSEEQGVSVDVLRENITKLYANKGVTLDADGANRELTAAYCENRLFKDENSIERLAQTDVSLFQRIRQWISDLVIRLRGTEEQKRVLEVQRLYEKAARNLGKVQDRGAQYQIQTLPDGREYVKADREVISGDDSNKWSKQAENFINEKIRENADLRVYTKDGFAIDITGRSAYKLSDPSVQSIEKVARPMLDREALKAKMQAAGHIDELAETARWSKFTPDRNGKHANDIGEDGFDTFTTYFEDSDGQYYRVRFTAGVNKDMNTAYSIGFMQKRNHPGSDGSSNSPFGSGAHTQMASDDSITQGATESKPKFSGLALQREYRQAMENGDMTRAREILAQKAALRGYSGYDTVQEAQNHVIQNANPVEDDYHTWIRSADDVRTFAETLQDSDWRGMDFDPDYTWDMAQDALKNGEITVYSSYPIGTPGGFVTPSRMEAEGYAGNGEVYSKRVNIDDVAWIDPTQGQYAPAKQADVYKQGSPYAKSLDVTYDDNGRLIPLSQRFDDSRADKRYSLGFTTRDIAHPNTMQDAMQYGKTPEQAVMEAAVQAGRVTTIQEPYTGAVPAQAVTAEHTAPQTISENAVDGAQVRKNPSADTNLQEQAVQNGHGDSYEYVTDENREFFHRIGAGNDRQPTQIQKNLFDQDMSRVKWLSDTDYAARHEQSAELRTAWEQVRQLDKKIEQERKLSMLSDADERVLQATLINRQTSAFEGNENQAALLHLYQLGQERNTLMEPLREYSKARREAMDMNAMEAADNIATYAKDKKIPGAYSRETMERNSYDIFGKDHVREAETLNNSYFEPVHKAVADKTKYVQTMVDRVAGLKLNKHESAMAQMLMEGEYGGLSEYAKNNHIKLTPQLAGKLKNAAQQFRLMYNDMYERISDTLIANGMWDSIPGYLKDYAPHFTLDKPETALQRIRFALGLGKDSTLTLPTDLAGITDEFRPGKKWFGNLLHREGEITDYDAVAGFERYVNTAADVIFLTDSVQNLRSLEEALRYRLSDEGTKAKINELRNNIGLDSLSRYQQVDQAYNTDTDSIQRLLDQKHAGMAGYVSNLREYINNLAGKKSKADRGWEDLLGRQMYNVARNAEGRVAANMIAANPGSWITNFIPITQAAGEVSTPNLIRAMKDTIASAIKDDGFEDASAFLTNRRGVDGLNKSLTRKVSDLLGKPMECIDQFTAIFRCRRTATLWIHANTFRVTVPATTTFTADRQAPTLSRAAKLRRRAAARKARAENRRLVRAD